MVHPLSTWLASFIRSIYNSSILYMWPNSRSLIWMALRTRSFSVLSLSHISRFVFCSVNWYVGSFGNSTSQMPAVCLWSFCRMSRFHTQIALCWTLLFLIYVFLCRWWCSYFSKYSTWTLLNMNKTKIMISGERQKVTQRTVRWPCGVCGRGVGNNSLQCTSCQKWVHRKCSGIKYKVMKTFICRGYMIPAFEMYWTEWWDVGVVVWDEVQTCI